MLFTIIRNNNYYNLLKILFWFVLIIIKFIYIYICILIYKIIFIEIFIILIN